jgi:hypothetical protein
MSYCEIYVIDATGQVARFDKVHNPHGWCPALWDLTAEKFGIGERFHLQWEQQRKVWALFDDSRLTPTFDRVWIRRARCSELAAALDVFHDQLMTREPDCTPTAQRMATVIRRALLEKPDLMGVCFRGTSVADCLWQLGEEDDFRMINILKDPHCDDGLPHWEIDSITP